MTELLIGNGLLDLFPKNFQLKRVLKAGSKLKTVEEFWDFLGGQGTYDELLDCFEKAGKELRPEIDGYFGKFNNRESRGI
ncbi:MAG: TdeIII family type II restriction endonuclease [Planctomycetaceae bacterium]|jgi:hypothetical protein|nr:TdeIII family type II restriction endonuclease [Planctomycetaceae bacterium]